MVGGLGNINSKLSYLCRDARAIRVKGQTSNSYFNVEGLQTLVAACIPQLDADASLVESREKADLAIRQTVPTKQ